MSDDPLKIVAVVSTNGSSEALVLNRPLKLRYRLEGRDYIGQDGPFRDVLVWESASRAFAGRELSLAMEDGTTAKVKDHWWQSYIPGTVSVSRSDVDSLKKCYVFYGGACILPEDLKELRLAYSGCVYPYWDYEKIIKFDDQRRELWRRIFHEEKRRRSLVKAVKAKHAELLRLTNPPAAGEGE